MFERTFSFWRRWMGKEQRATETGGGTAVAEDRRLWVRYECAVRATYQRIGDESEQSRDARVLNISATGVGMLLTETVEPGSLLHLTLHGKQGQPVRTILACVVHSTLRAGGELAVGCNF